MFNISALLPSLPTLKITDVGAMSLGTGSEPYARLLASLNCEVIGFEPDAVECEKLSNANKPGHKYLPYYIGDGSQHTFYECNYAMTSSLLEPNTELLAKFQYLEELTRVVKTYTV